MKRKHNFFTTTIRKRKILRNKQEVDFEHLWLGRLNKDRQNVGNEKSIQLAWVF